MKKIIVAIALVLCVFGTRANDIATSQAYVDTAAAGLQDKLPAKTSDKVATYTTTAGATGEREIKTELGNESTNQSDSGLTTVGTVSTAVNAKQTALNPLRNVNIVTYGGDAQYDNFNISTATPIYDSTVNTFDNGLVTAKTLNDAVIAGVNAEVTRINTPKGTLWQFNRTAPKVLPTTANLPANIRGASGCYRNITKKYYPDTQNNCSSTMFNSMVNGDWGVVFPHNTGITYDTTCVGESCGKEVHGISACIDEQPVKRTVPVPSNNTALITKLRQSYDTYKSGGTLPNDYQYCYCKLEKPVIQGSYWVFVSSYADGAACAADCALRCELHVVNRSAFRASLFGAVPVPAAPAQSE